MARNIVCIECKKEKFHCAKGLCRTCYNRLYLRRWRKENPERAKYRGYTAPQITCKECGKQKPHQARELCKTCYGRFYYWAFGKEKKLASNRRWQKAHPEKMREYGRRYYWRHKEQRLANFRAWCQANPEAELTRHRRWRENNREAVNTYAQAHNRLRRALKHSLPATLTVKQTKRLLKIGQATYPGQTLHLDHFVSVNRGGGTTAANCHFIPVSLNLSKSDKLPKEVYVQKALI